MRIEVTLPEKEASTGAYSPAVDIDGWIYVSGQGPIDLATGRPRPGTIEEEVELTMENIRKILDRAGCTFDDVVKCACHLSDIGDFDRFNATYRQYFQKPYPARTTVQSVLGEGIKVEIDCVARRPRSRT